MGRRQPETGTRHNGRGRIWPAVRHFNASLGVLIAVCALPPACSQKPETAASDAGPKPVASKPLPTPSVELSANELLVGIPELPGHLGIRLGDSLSTLRAARPEARVDPLTTAIWSEDLAFDTPFAVGTYLLGRQPKTLDTVETIILTLKPEYGHPEHFKSLEKAIADKLGKGRPTEHAGFRGLDWAVPGRRIELRQDTRRDNEPELVFDSRGGREIEMP